MPETCSQYPPESKDIRRTIKLCCFNQASRSSWISTLFESLTQYNPYLILRSEAAEICSYDVAIADGENEAFVSLGLEKRGLLVFGIGKRRLSCLSVTQVHDWRFVFHSKVCFKKLLKIFNHHLEILTGESQLTSHPKLSVCEQKSWVCTLFYYLQRETVVGIFQDQVDSNVSELRSEYSLLQTPP